MPAESVGLAKLDDRVLDIGGVKVRLPVAWPVIEVFVRRDSRDLSIAEVAIAIDDSLDLEETDAANVEAARHPLGAKEYWRSKMVGEYLYGAGLHPMTEEEFEREWEEDA